MANHWKTPREAAAHMADLAIEDIEELERMLATLRRTMIDVVTACNDPSHDMGSIATADMTDAMAVMARAHRRMGSAASFVALGFYQEEAQS
jgi:hypothetical protein